MSASTSPDNIIYPVSTDAFGPLETAFATMATSIQTALNSTKTYRTADLNSLAAITGMATGSLASVIEGGAIFAYDGTLWQQKTQATFASSGVRDTAYAKATGSYKINGVMIYRSDKAFTQIYRPVQAGVGTAGWYSLGLSIQTAVGSQNPIPTGVASDVGGIAATITTGANEFVCLIINYTGKAQMNPASYTVNLNLVVNGGAFSDQIIWNSGSATNMQIPGSGNYITVLPAGTANIVKLQGVASSASNGVLTNVKFSATAVDPVTLT